MGGNKNKIKEARAKGTDMKKEEMEELYTVYSRARTAHKYIAVNEMIMPSLNI